MVFVNKQFEILKQKTVCVFLLLVCNLSCYGSHMNMGEENVTLCLYIVLGLAHSLTCGRETSSSIFVSGRLSSVCLVLEPGCCIPAVRSQTTQGHLGGQQHSTDVPTCWGGGRAAVVCPEGVIAGLLGMEADVGVSHLSVCPRIILHWWTSSE